MDELLANLARLLRLAAPAVLGVVAGWRQLFASPRAAIDALNTYALTIGFPALVASGLVDSELALPSQLAFYGLWPAALLVSLAVVAAIGGAHRGTLGLVAAFGNVAYLGLPLALATLGESMAGAASLAVTVHVTLSVTVGPLVLERWSVTDGDPPSLAALLGRVARLPLAWAPLFGLAVRGLPDVAREEIAALLGPLAASAAPVALFLLGLYVWEERRRLARIDGPVLLHVAVVLGVVPAVALALGWGAVAAGWLAPELAELHVLLAAMPAGITTFAIAHRAGVGSERVAGAIVGTTLVAGLAIPAWAAVAGWVFRG